MARRQSSNRGYYVYPIAGQKGQFTVGRIDQGQDFTGKLSVLALGRAKVVKLGAPGWPGGGGVLLKLLEGPYRGRYFFANEAIRPTVREGQEVQAGEVIGHVNSSYPGLEIGWANSAGVPLSHAEYHEGLETRAGKAFAGFISGLPKMGPHGGFSGNFSPGEEAKAHKQAGEEGLGEGVIPGPGGLLAGLFGDIHPEALMLNIGLIGGGAFLAYYGAALMLGVKRPVAAPAQAAAGAIK